MPKELTLIGFDYGSHSIGVAIGQTVTHTARALTAIQSTNNRPNWSQLDPIIEEWKPDAFVVGIPLNMDGTPQNTTAAAKQFIALLQERYQNIPVHECDERLTTVEAKQQLFDQEGYRALKKSSIDAMSAKLILESWMQEQKKR